MIVIWNGLGCLVIPVVIVGVHARRARSASSHPNQRWLQLVAVAFTSLALIGLGWLLNRRQTLGQDRWGNAVQVQGRPLPLLGPGAILVRHRRGRRRDCGSLRVK